MKFDTRKLKKVLQELINDMDEVGSDSACTGTGVAIGTNGKYTISIDVDRFRPDESISDKYVCLTELEDATP
jgi:hypothetical protein